MLSLTEAVAIARAIALKSGQRIDSSQEFIGQGLANVVGSFASSYVSSGSFTRSGSTTQPARRRRWRRCSRRCSWC
ncbi:sulfate permease [Methylibium sp. T29]|nr:sulfate permease [Methylibium sp. T29]